MRTNPHQRDDLSPADRRFLDNLSEITVFVSHDSALGIPMPFFLALCGFSIFFAFDSGFLPALIFFVFTAAVLRMLHRDDPKALEIAIRNLGAPARYSPCVPDRGPVRVIDPGDLP